MILTRNKIDRLTALWNAEVIDLKTVIINLCELRLYLDDSISDNIDI